MRTLICGVPALAAILSYAALLPRARWQGDEYLVFSEMREGSWGFLQSWYLGWSPRLFSDALYAAYGAAVAAAHRPLAASCMAVLWAALFCACVLPALARSGRAARVLAGMSLFALFLTGHAVTEVFYWPAGGLSYVPTLAGVVWLFWLCADGFEASRSAQACAAAALFVAGGSSEVGVFAVLSICVCVSGAQLGKAGRAWLWMLPGLAVSVLDLALVLHGRVGVREGSSADPSLLHHAGASMAAALPQFFGELAVPVFSGGAPSSVWLGVGSRIVVFLAARWSLGRVRGALLPAFGVAVLVAAFVSLTSAYYQFGRLCCQRHDTMRACFICLAVAAFGACSGRLGRLRAGNAAAPAWAASVILLFLPASPALLADFRSMDQATANRARSWVSGFGPGEDMVFVRDPPGQVINANKFATGPVSLGTEIAWYQRGILQFFGKRRMMVVDSK